MKKTLSVVAAAILLVAAIILFSQPSHSHVRQQAKPQAKLSDEQIKLGMQMQAAVLAKQDFDEIQRILDAGFDINGPIGCGTFNCVDGAVSVGNVKMLKFFLAKGAEPKGEAVLHSVYCREPEVSYQLVKTLLEAGGDAGYREYFPTNYVTGDTRWPDPSRFTSPLHAACYKGDYDVAELLLSHPGVAIDALDTDGRTPLMWAAEKGNKKLVKLLLAKSANVNIKNGRGETALSKAGKLNGDGSEISQLLANVH